MKIFVSYTSSDRRWAHWIAWQPEGGHQPFVHEWEIGAGQNIPRWMEERLDEADHLIGSFFRSLLQCNPLPKRAVGCILGRYRRDRPLPYPNRGEQGYKWPRLIKPLNRLSLVGLNESKAQARLTAFLKPRRPPAQKPEFPGAEESDSASFTDNSEPLGSLSPGFPDAASITGQITGIEISSLPPVETKGVKIRCIEDHEPKPQIFGRTDEIEAIVNAALDGKTVLVAGGPGIGKTAVTIAAFYDSRLVKQFGQRRVFASLETATEPRAILAKLVETLGLPATGDEGSLLRILEINAAEQPLAAILDNAETVFDTARETAERLLKLAAQIQGLSLVVTIRGVAPPIPGATQIDDLSALDLFAASEAFLDIAGKSFKGDPDLQHLLHALDGHALSLRLVAAQAIGSSSLRGLRESWDEVHAEILKISGEQEDRLNSLRASLALSLNSRRMKSVPLARRLMSLLAFLPGGLAESDVHSLLGDRGVVSKARANEAIICLHQLRLVERRPDRQLRMLTPLRESVKSEITPLEPDRERLIEHYLALCAKAQTLGGSNWENSREVVEAEADNLDPVCALAVDTRIDRKGLEHALVGLAKLRLFSGICETTSIDKAVTRLRDQAPSVFLARCSYRLAEIARLQFDTGTAIARYEEALGSVSTYDQSYGRSQLYSWSRRYCLDAFRSW